jgi:hypothetical protein
MIENNYYFINDRGCSGPQDICNSNTEKHKKRKKHRKSSKKLVLDGGGSGSSYPSGPVLDMGTSLHGSPEMLPCYNA